jgi:hypothetical protein
MAQSVQTKMQLVRKFQEAQAKLREAKFEVESAELDAIQFLVDTRQTHLLKVYWSRMMVDAQNER